MQTNKKQTFRGTPENLKEVFMNEIKSGKELCDNFFDQLVERKDIDSKAAILVKDLYSKKCRPSAIMGHR